MIGNEILSALTQQSGNDGVNSNSSSLTFTEVYKGPWTTITQLATSSGFAIGVARSSTPVGQWDHQFPAPTTPSGYAWYLSQVQTSELEAGDYGEIRLTWALESIAQHQTDPDAPDLSTVTVNWDCSWAAESKSVLAYCSNGGINLDSDHTKAFAGNIKMWSEEENAQLKASNSFQYDGLEYKLNGNEISVGQLYVKDVNPVFHSPIVTKTTMRNTSALSSIEITGIDTLQSPSGSPFTFDDDWEFILLGNDVTYEEKKYYSKRLSADQTFYTLTRKETWAGHKNPREEFYGENAWKIGEL